MLQNSAQQVKLWSGGHCNVQNIIFSLCILNSDVFINIMKRPFSFTLPYQKGHCKWFIYMVNNQLVFPENISFRTVITCFQSVSILHWGPRVLWMLAFLISSFICKILLSMLLNVGWFLRHISSYEGEYVPKESSFQKGDVHWGPRSSCEAVWCSRVQSSQRDWFLILIFLGFTWYAAI